MSVIKKINMGKAIYQAQRQVQRINLHEKKYPVLIDFLNNKQIPSRIKEIIIKENKEWNEKRDIKAIVEKAVNSCLGRPDGKIEVESELWATIKEEAKDILTVKDKSSCIVLHVREFDYTFVLTEKKDEATI